MDSGHMERAVEALSEAFFHITECARELAESISGTWRAIGRIGNVPAKWLHYANNSKRARIRKKYHDKIQRFLLEE